MPRAEVFRLGESGLDVSPLEQQREFSYQIRIYDRSGNKVGEFASGIKNTKLVKFNFGYLRDGGCADFSFTLGDVSPFTIDYHYLVEICFYDQANPWYSGYITKRPERGTAKQQTYSGYGYRKQLDGIRVNEVDTAQEVATIIGDTLDNYITGNTDIVKDTNKIPAAVYAMVSTIYWDRIPASDLFERLRQLAGAYEWGVDEERDFYFRRISTQIFENFWIGKHLDSFKGTEDPEPIRNRLYVKCGRLTDGSDYILQVPDPATEPTASQIAYGLKEDVVTAPEFWPTLDPTDLVTALAGAANPPGTNPGFAIDGNPANYWDSDAGQAVGDYITVDLGTIYNEITRVVLDSTTALARDQFARGFDIRISTTGAFGGEEVVVFTSVTSGDLSTNNPDIRFSPTRGRYVRITLTTVHAAEHWHLGGFGVYQMGTSDVRKWANYILDQKKVIRKKASLTIKKVNELIERKHVIVPYKPRGQWGIYDEDGNHIEDYPVISVQYSLSGDSFDMTAELGELERESISAEFKRQLQRMEEFNMSGVRRSDDLASGVGASPLGITGTMIGKEEIETPHLKANTIVANLIEAGAVTAEKMSILKHLVSGATWTDNNPIAGSVSWTGASVTYNGITYAIADGNTALAYIWWDFSLATGFFQTAGAKPVLADEDFIACFNNGGTHELVWNATLIEGGTIRTGSVNTDELTALAVTTEKLDALAVTAGKINAGAVTAPKINVLKHLVSGAVWGDNDPGAGSVSWTGASVTYNGITYAIADGNTALAYIWWDFSLATGFFQTAGAKPVLADEDFIACFNNGGTHELVWNATLIEGGTIRTGSVNTDELNAGAVTAVKINVADLVNIANLLTVAAGRIAIGANVLGAGLDGILITDAGAVRRMEIGEVAAGIFAVNIRDSAGVLTTDEGEHQEIWRKIYDNTLVAAATTVTLAGLSGDADVQYMVTTKIISGVAAATDYSIRLNNDAGNNYGRTWILGDGAVATSGTLANSIRIFLSDSVAASQIATATAFIWAYRDGQERMVESYYGYRAAVETVGRIALAAQLWNNVGADISSIVFHASQANGFAIGTHFMAFKRV